MTDKNINDTNNSCFYLPYAKQYYWIIEEAIALSLSLNPSKKIPESCNREYKARIELLKKAMECNLELELDGSVKRPFYFSDSVTYPNIKPSSFIHWCKRKDFSFPEELETLVRKYHMAESENFKTENQELKKKISELEAECKKMHGNSENSYQSMLFIALREAYKIAKDITKADFVEFEKQYLKSVEEINNSADIKLPFKPPNEKTIKKIFETMRERFYDKKS